MSGRYRIRRKPGRVLRVDDLQEDRVDGYWNMNTKDWFPLDWLDAGSELVQRERDDTYTTGNGRAEVTNE